MIKMVHSFSFRNSVKVQSLSAYFEVTVKDLDAFWHHVVIISKKTIVEELLWDWVSLCTVSTVWKFAAGKVLALEERRAVQVYGV